MDLTPLPCSMLWFGEEQLKARLFYRLSKAYGVKGGHRVPKICEGESLRGHTSVGLTVAPAVALETPRGDARPLAAHLAAGGGVVVKGHGMPMACR